MARQVIKKLKVTLVTQHPEAVSYLEGYLRGIHDVGWIRMRPLYRFSNEYEWFVEIKEPRFAYSKMDGEEIGNDLGQHLELSLSDYKINRNWKHRRDYKIHVNELDANVEF